VHNERFMEPVKDWINTLRFRATYGLVGNDNISDTRFFYLSDVNLEEAARGYTFGNQYGNQYIRPGVMVNRYANPFVTWEISRQTNLGIDLGLFHGTLNGTLDFFHQYRYNIVQERVA